MVALLAAGCATYTAAVHCLPFLERVGTPEIIRVSRVFCCLQVSESEVSNKSRTGSMVGKALMPRFSGKYMIARYGL